MGRTGRGAVRGDPGGLPRGRRSDGTAPLRPVRASGLRAGPGGSGRSDPPRAARTFTTRWTSSSTRRSGACASRSRSPGWSRARPAARPAGAGGQAAEPCAACEGRPVRVALHRDRPVAARCGACGGTGWRLPPPCPGCGGRGTRARPRRIQVTVPPGVDTGAQVRAPGRGPRRTGPGTPGRPDRHHPREAAPALQPEGGPPPL